MLGAQPFNPATHSSAPVSLEGGSVASPFRHHLQQIGQGAWSGCSSPLALGRRGGVGNIPGPFPSTLFLCGTRHRGSSRMFVKVITRALFKMQIPRTTTGD